MKLSVIVPVYNGESTLKRCVESILAQSFTNWELILVDDGSIDNSGIICNEYVKANSHITVIHKDNRGLSEARNSGLKQVQGEFVTFIDCDDFISEDTFEQVMAFADDDPEIEIVEYPVKVHYGHKSEEELMFDNIVYQDNQSYWIDGKAYTHTYACNKIFRSYLFDEVKFPNGKIFEDAWILPLLLKKNPVIMTISEGMYYYCQNNKSITAQASGKDLQILLNAQIEASNLLNISFNSKEASKWYLHTLNTQLDVCKLCHTNPILPNRKLPYSIASTKNEKIKITILNLFGIDFLCKLKRMMTNRF